MSLSWDPDDASTDEAGWRTRLGAWFSPSPAELAGLAVLLVGALVLSGVLWLQAVSRPTSLGAPDGVALDPDGHGHAAAGSNEAGAQIGAVMDAAGSADGDAPGVDADGANGTAGGNGVESEGGAVGRDVDGRGDGPQLGGSMVVHVTGAVRSSGLVSLPVGARIGDAVVAAGGASPDALVERVNLARMLVDGEHVHVPREGDDPATLPPIGGAAPGVGSAAGGSAGGVGGGGGTTAPIHLNRATAAELETLPGIGPARAEAIVTHREQQGPFATPGDLRAVSGIGEATFQRLAPLITVD